MGIVEGRRHPAQQPSQFELHRCGMGVDMLIARGGRPLFEDWFTGMPLLFTDVNLRYAISVIKEVHPVPSKHYATKIIRLRQPWRIEGTDEIKTIRQSFYLYEDPEKIAFGEQPEQRVDAVDAVEYFPYPASLDELDEYKDHLIAMERELYLGNLEASAHAAATHNERLSVNEDPAQEEIIRRWGVPIGLREAVLGDPALHVVLKNLELSLKFSIHSD